MGKPPANGHSPPTSRHRMADEQIGQNEIEQLLQQATGSGGAAPPGPPSKPAETAPPAETARTAERAPTAENDSAASGAVQQNEIDDLLNELGGGAPATETTSHALGAAATASAPAAVSERVAQPSHESGTADDVHFLLDQAEQAIGSIDQPSAPAEGLADFKFRNLDGTPPSEEEATLDLLRDVELDLKIELGRTHMYLEEVLKLRRGSVVSLDKLAGDPVDVYVNGRLIARGEVLVLNDNFCVRVAELISGDDQ